MIQPLEEGSTLAWEVPMRLGDQPVVARGHLERRAVTGSYSSRLVGSPQPFDGVVAQMLDGRSPGLFLRNASDAPVLIVGADGEAFARVGPGGAEVNRRSPMWFRTNQANGAPVDGLDPDAGAEPDWVVVSPQASLAWLDDRGRWPADAPPADAATATEPVVVLEWSVPLERDGERREVRAVTSWLPAVTGDGTRESGPGATGGGEGLPLWLVLAAPVVAVLAVLAIRGARSAPRRSC